MNAERWEQVKDLFASALSFAPLERSRFLEENCDDAELRKEVESLLASHDVAADFIEKPRFSVQWPTTSTATADLGMRVGAYELVRELGRGGMGSVFLAVRADQEFQKRVAIKLIRRDIVDEGVVRRFRNERQILARLEHPYIARLIDGGTESGLPYFVMEFVEGLPFGRYCDDNALGVRKRLEVFLKVCSAVQYAHERNIVHRDLKPTNILVKRDGTPKLLDFGIAKLLDPAVNERKLETTVAGMRVMTPAYASPEQLRGEVATVASDIYSLGIVLFESLTGRRPMHGIAAQIPAELASAAIYRSLRFIADEPPISPELLSASRGCESLEDLARDLAGNVDVILERALRADPADRYSSVAEFVADIERHLRDENVPVQGRTARSAEDKSGGRRGDQRPTLAVLPFRTLNTGHGTDDYLGMGMADALITKLTNVGRIAVRPTSAIMRYTDAADPAEAGRALDVNFVLEGRIHKAGDRVRVTVQLVQIATGSSIWAAQFDEQMEDLLKLEDSLSSQLAVALVPQLSGEERQQLARRGTNSAKAHQAYLKGRWFWSQNTENSLAQSLVSFSEAIAEDPQYASAYAGIADYYIRLGCWGGLPPSESFAAAKDAAGKALGINSELAEAHTSLAFALWALDFDTVAAEREFHLATSLNPEYATAHHWLALLHSAQDRPDLAIASIQRACRIDPLSQLIGASYILCLYQARQYQRAIEQCRNAITHLGDLSIFHEMLAWCYLEQSRIVESLSEARIAAANSVRNEFALSVLAHAHAARGEKTEVAGILADLLGRRKERYVSSYLIALVYLANGDQALSLEWLTRARDERDWWVVWSRVGPRFDPLRANKRFEGLLVSVDRHAAETAAHTTDRALKTQQLVSRRRLIEVAVAALVLVIVLYAVATSKNDVHVPFAQTKMSKLTGDGTTGAAAIAPDGKYVAFTTSAAGKQYISVRQTDVAGTVRVAGPFEGGVGSLAFSRDGRYLTFSTFPRNESAHGVFYRVPTLGGTPDKISDEMSGPSALSPDGKLLAVVFQNAQKNADELIVSGVHGESRRVVGVRRHPDRFSWTSMPAWSDNSQLVAAAIQGSDKAGYYERFSVIPVDGGEGRRPESPRFQTIHEIAWMANGKGLVVIGQEQDSSFSEIWYVPHPSGKPKRVNDDLHTYDGVSLSADGKSLVSVQTQTITNIFVLNKADPRQSPQITPGGGRYFDLSWSPDGRIAYASDSSGEADIYMMNADGSGARQITSGSRRNYAPDVSPDGRTVVFHSNRTGNWNLWQTGSDGANPRAITTGTKDSNWPQFTPDGKFVVYHHSGQDALWNLWQAPLDGGSPVQLTQALSQHPAVNPRDGRIACWYSEDATKPRWRVAILPPTGGNPLQVLDLPPHVYADTTLRWTPDGSSLTFVDRRDGISNLWIQAVSGGPAKPLTNFAWGMIYSFDWSRDGRLVFSRGMSTRDAVLLRDITE